ncbi:hypothetical protein [Streptomyces silaceus]|uniref:hypothetical protein n=1 Tax=Streptomyces silaceus TaxID=545123 RepID=UPI0006EB88AA|nr:hypothetical protein [Streptomyces silaceus]
MPYSLRSLVAHTPVLGLVRGSGRHRPARPSGDRAPLDPPSGAVRHGFRHCTPCGTDTVAILHRTGHTCGDCGHEHYTDEGGDQ